MGFLPDEVAFVASFSVCRCIGLVKEGMQLFEQMKSKYKIKPGLYFSFSVASLDSAADFSFPKLIARDANFCVCCMISSSTSLMSLM